MTSKGKQCFHSLYYYLPDSVNLLYLVYRPSRLAKTVKRKELSKTWEYMELFDHVLFNEIYS